MSGKAVFVFVQALLVQTVFSQCIGRGIDSYGFGSPYGWAGRGLAGQTFGPAAPFAGCAGKYYEAAYPAMDFTPTSGGGLPVTSSSVVPPTGISIMSDNAYEGILGVIGELPFVGTTAVDGVLPTLGAGAINHGCGNGLNAMTALSETSTPASIATTSMASPYGMPATAAFAAPAVAAPAAVSYAAAGIPATAFAAPAFTAPAMAYEGIILDAPCGAYAYDALDAIEITPTSGGALPVSSASAVPPTGISVASETAYEGPLAVIGELPFVGTVDVEGVMPTAGAGAINHACGNGVNAMVSESTAFAGYPAMAPAMAAGYPAMAPATAAGYGYSAGWAGRGCGCGRAF